MSENGKKIEDGVYPVYVKDGVVYPIGLTQEQLDMYKLTTSMIFHDKIRVDFKHPMGKAIDIKELNKGDK